MNGLRWEMTHPQIGEAADYDVRPARVATRLSADGIRQAASDATDRRRGRGTLRGTRPGGTAGRLREHYGLIGITDAIREIHARGTRQQLADARRRFVFQEFLLEQLAFAFRRHQLWIDDGRFPSRCHHRWTPASCAVFPFR